MLEWSWYLFLDTKKMQNVWTHNLLLLKLHIMLRENLQSPAKQSGTKSSNSDSL